MTTPKITPPSGPVNIKYTCTFKETTASPFFTLRPDTDLVNTFYNYGFPKDSNGNNLDKATSFTFTPSIYKATSAGAPVTPPPGIYRLVMNGGSGGVDVNTIMGTILITTGNLAVLAVNSVDDGNILDTDANKPHIWYQINKNVIPGYILTVVTQSDERLVQLPEWSPGKRVIIHYAGARQGASALGFLLFQPYESTTFIRYNSNILCKSGRIQNNGYVHVVAVNTLQNPTNSGENKAWYVMDFRGVELLVDNYRAPTSSDRFVTNPIIV
jgi:hypothetical protein